MEDALAAIVNRRKCCASSPKGLHLHPDGKLLLLAIQEVKLPGEMARPLKNCQIGSATVWSLPNMAISLDPLPGRPATWKRGIPSRMPVLCRHRTSHNWCKPYRRAMTCTFYFPAVAVPFEKPLSTSRATGYTAAFKFRRSNPGNQHHQEEIILC